MAVELGNSGQQLVGLLFFYTPHDRPSSSEVLEHPFLAVCFFPLIGVRLEDGTCLEGSRPSVIFDSIGCLGRQLPHDGIYCKFLYPLVRGVPGQSLLAGERHQRGMHCIEFAREIVLHLLGDDAFLEGTDANRGGHQKNKKRKTVCSSVRHQGTENEDRGSLGYVCGHLNDWHLYQTSMSCCSGY